MWCNIHDYVETTLKYLLIFESKDEMHNDDYLIFENIQDSGMPGLLNCVEATIPTFSSPHQHCNAYFSDDSREDERVFWTNIHYYYDSLSLNKIYHVPYHDLIQENENIRFKIIRVPMSIGLYQKIRKLILKNVCDFDLENLCVMLNNIFLFDEHGKGSIAYAVCTFLQNNPYLLEEVRKCNENNNDGQLTSSVKLLAEFLFGEVYEAIQFRKYVKLYLTVKLTDSNENHGELSSKSLLYSYYTQIVDPNDLLLEFLFDELRISYEWLNNNRYVLDTKFENIKNKSQYTVIIYKSTSLCNHKNEYRILMQTLNQIKSCKFLMGTNVGELVLKFSNVNILPDLSFLNQISALVMIKCYFCSINFIKKIPIKIKVMMCVSEELSEDFIREIPENVFQVKFVRSNFREYVILPNHIQSITIYDNYIDKNAALILSRESNDITITRTPVKIHPLCIMTKGTVCLITAFDSKFLMKKDQVSGLRSLTLSSSKIDGKMNISGIEVVIFELVELSSRSSVSLCESNKYISISKSSGLFDLKLHIGVDLYFEDNMTLTAWPTVNSTHNTSKIKLANCLFQKTVKFADKYKQIELNCVSTSKNVEIILNTACEKLIVYKCAAIINVKNVKNFDKLTLQFSLSEKNHVKFIGLKSVNHLRLINISREVTSIISLLTAVENVKHLEFRSTYKDEKREDINEYMNVFTRTLSAEEDFERFPDLKSKCLSVKDTKPSIFIYEISDIMVNYILKLLLGKGTFNSVIKLVFISISIDIINCKSFVKMVNLEILQMCARNTTNEFLYNLPAKLKLLNICNSFASKRSWKPKYVIKPSIIVHPHNNLKVLVISSHFLSNITSAFILLPKLEVLRIRYSILLRANPREKTNRLKIRKLIIKCGAYMIRHCEESINKGEMASFINDLKTYVDFDFLKYWIITGPNQSIMVNPKTQEVLKREY
ncbi:putative LRR containing protein [Trachipleistophora hominis]|uniref:Putative LRR containing protein n=1 Tax=Trachipleistophora hominis TaxID=72359 RepID=L7JU71_TRAHO|nr:putative LRR containing protein [Trachipleistophora hominis]